MPVVSLPAPYGGQNNKDGEFNLEPIYATSLVNWVPGPGYLDARGPCIQFSNNTAGAPIQSIWGHPNGNVIFALTNGDIYRAQATIGAAITTAPTNGDFHGNTFQDRLILCNGVNGPQIYDGTTVTPGSYGTTPAPTVAALYGSLTFKGRAYYWENNSRRFWYAAAGAFQNTLQSFDLSTFTRGDGTLVSICPLTFDGGSGPDDLIAFLFSNGEVLVYQGDDPGNTNSWQQVGAFRIGRMIGRSCWAVVGSATLVATELGVVDLARALSVGPTDDSATAGQQFGAVNMTPTSGTLTERKLAFDQANRILWLGLLDGSQISTAANLRNFHGMDTDSRSWFTTAGIGAAFGGTGTTTAFFATPTGLLLGATTTGRLVTGPARAQTGSQTPDFFTSNIQYVSDQTFSLDSANRNKQCTGIAFQMQRTSLVDPASTMTYEVRSSRLETVPGVVYQPDVLVRAFNPASAYGTRITVQTSISAESGLRWFNTDLLVRAGREV
jgi:hypothetical protein